VACGSCNENNDSVDFLACLGATVLTQPAQVGAQATMEAVYQFPPVAIRESQNAKLPGSVANDRKVLLGSVGSDLWRGANDAPGEFWMVTDRGPNGQIRVDGRNRRTFGCQNSIRPSFGSKWGTARSESSTRSRSSASPASR
jgi:hypothetical protein